MKAIDEDIVFGTVLEFCTKAFDSDGALNNDVAVNNEFSNVDVCCKTDVDMVDAIMFAVDVEGEPINGT